MREEKKIRKNLLKWKFCLFLSDTSMESSGGDKQNESDECDVTANNQHHKNKMTGQEDSNGKKSND